MANFFRPVVRMSAFLRKEIMEVLRQPRLIFTLVLGPFLILLIFGIGYHNVPRQLRTLFVAPSGSPIANDIIQYAPNIGPQLIFEGVIPDKNKALNLLREGKVDLVVVAPTDAYQTILSNKQAVFTLYHHEIDPFQVDYVDYFGQYYVEIVNRQVIQAITAQSQAESKNYLQDIQAAKANTEAARSALKSGNMTAAQQSQQKLVQNIGTLGLAVGASLGVLSGVEQKMGSAPSGNSSSELLALLNDAQQNSNQLQQPNSANTSANLARLDKIDQDLTTLQKNLKEFQSISPDILVSPFTSQTKSIAATQPTPMIFFAPAVLALLLQHLAVTFAALSIVRERIGGTMEIFRVSPLTAAETLVGKYLSYMIFGGVIAAILIALTVYALHIPMLGNWWYVVLVVVGILFASLSIGFLISILSQTDSQAVQYSMIVLLTSVFFSGFILNLNMILKSVRIISWAIPTTYGVITLRNIMLRGVPPDMILIIGLFGIGLGLAIVSWLLLRRLISISME